MFRYFHLQNLPQFFTDYFMSNDFHMISIMITQETHHYSKRHLIEQIIKIVHSLTKGLIYGIIFLYNTNKFDLFLYSKRQ